MDRAHRLLQIALLGILLLTAAVCGLGIHLTAAQYRDMQAILLEAEKRAAAQQHRAIEAYLDENESAALDALLEAGEDVARVRGVTGRFPYLHAPFFITAGGAISTPLLGESWNASALVTDSPPPEAFREALRLVHSDAPLAEKTAALETLAASSDVDEHWGLRASVNLAALLEREADLESASVVYEQLFADPRDLLAANAAPSYAHLSLAFADVLLRAAQPRRAAGVLMRALRRLLAGELRSDLAEEHFFLHQAQSMFDAAEQSPPDELVRAQERLASARLTRTVTETLKDLIESRTLLQGTPDGAVQPQYFVARLAGHLVPVVWTPVTAGPRASELLAVGFRIDIEELQKQLETQLVPGLQGEPLQVLFSEESLEDDHVTLTTLPGELSFLGLGMARDAWERQLGRKRRPFLFAAVLIGVLGVTLLGGLIFLHRGVRRALALSRMKTEFVANVSHELKTPLALIRLCGETLQLERLPEKEQQNKYYQIIARESERLGHLISNVLNFNSIEAGRKTYRLEPCDPGQVCREVVESYRFQLEEKGFEFVSRIPDELPPILADAEAVAQAVINLLENAVKYSPDTRRIEINVVAAGGAVRITVADRGVGISTEDRQKIWEDYYRSGGARALGTRGSGLGLSLVRHIVRGHNGKVDLVSSPGEGSAFTLVFPVMSSTGREDMR